VIGITDGTDARIDDAIIQTMVSGMNGFLSAFRFLAEILWGEPRQVVRVRRTPYRELR
jgi:hypothetical protein